MYNDFPYNSYYIARFNQDVKKKNSPKEKINRAYGNSKRYV